MANCEFADARRLRWPRTNCQSRAGQWKRDSMRKSLAGFLPSTGILEHLRLPDDVRVDSARKRATR